MKNKIIAMTACGLLVSGFACADDLNFYLGGELGYNKHKYYDGDSNEILDYLPAGSAINSYQESAKKNVLNFGFMLGLRHHENVGVEVGYSRYKKSSFSSSGQLVVLGVGGTSSIQADVKVNNIYADLLGYIPINQNFEFIGAAGLGSAKFKVSSTVNLSAPPFEYSNSGTGSMRKVGFRLGVGAQYKFDKHIAARAMFRFQKVGKKADIELIKNMTSFNLGLTYTI